ncbi:MAG: hypothetical protein IPP46_16485 [Bacteroidetes bacterium]|nr:hypothetical protein [Bacteroidota bacterium]
MCESGTRASLYQSEYSGICLHWFANGGNILSGNGTGSVTVDWTTPGPATVALWYEETSTTVDTVCFGISDTIYITINPVPATGAITGNTTICESDTGNFSVTNTSGSTYQWTNSGGSILSGNGSNTVSANWNISGTTIISVTETNSFGCTGAPVTYSLTVNPLPNANAGSDNSICIGDSTLLSASGGISYQWSPATGLSNPGIANPIAIPTATTIYTVLVTDGNGCKNTDTVTLFVNPLPIVSAGTDVDICIGSSTQLNATGGSIYIWSPNTGLDNTFISNPTANPVSTITYSVIVIDSNGCRNSDQLLVTVNPLPTAQTGADTLICNGSSIVLQASGGVSYQWSPATGSNNPSIANPFASPGSPPPTRLRLLISMGARTRMSCSFPSMINRMHYLNWIPPLRDLIVTVYVLKRLTLVQML